MDYNVYKIKWSSKRQEDEIFNIINEINCDILGISLSDFGYDELNDIITIKETNNKIRFNNSIIKTPAGNNSNLSVEGTVALMRNYKFGAFIIPPDLIDYIRKEIPNRVELNRYLKNIPQNQELFDKGKVIFEAMLEEGYPTQAAYSLTGATFTECAWNPNVYNKAEKDKGSGSSSYAHGWDNCGEGLFGLTNWAQKEKIIKKLGLNQKADMYAFIDGKINKGMRPAANGITLNRKKYSEGPGKNSTNPLLFQCTEKEWIRIMKQYIYDLGKGKGDDKSTYDYLMYDKAPIMSRDQDDDDHKLLYASYLFKAGNAHKKCFSETVKCIEKYKSTHKKMYSKNNSNYTPKNGFVEQLLVAYLLAQYVNDVQISDLSLEDIFVGYGKLDFVGGNTRSSYNQYIYDNIIQEDTINDKYKRGDGKFNISKACNWFYNNVSGKAKHVCAKFVRKALEAGGIDTSKRPNWAWKYIDYLPTIGFRMVQKVTRSTLKDYIPQVGDISVYLKGNNPNVPGHICMYTPNGWYSDFKQANMFVYASTNEGYIFRYEGDIENNDEIA